MSRPARARPLTVGRVLGLPADLGVGAEADWVTLALEPGGERIILQLRGEDGRVFARADLDRRKALGLAGIIERTLGGGALQ